MKQFNKSEQRRFWEGNQDSFKGEVISEAVLRISRKYIKNAAIDVGAGDGSLLKAFKRLFRKARIVGLDLVPKSPSVLKGDCTKISFPDASFDTYFATDVIEHLSDGDLDRCLDEMNRVLKFGSHAIITTLFKENLLSSEVTCVDCGCRFHRWGHCQVFTESRIRRLLRDKGFKIVEIKKLNLIILARFRILGKFFYGLRMERFFGFKFLTPDLYIVAKKIADLKTD